MKKAEIWMADLNPEKGSEQAGKRPVVIVSGNLLNTHAPVLWVCPLTTKIKNYKGGIVVQPNVTNGLEVVSEVLVMHLRSLSKEGLVQKMGTLEKSELERIRKGISETLLMD